MSNQEHSPASQPDEFVDDAGIEELLRQVGVRDEPSPAMADEVMRAVHAVWRDVIDARVRRRRFVGYGIAAGLATAVLTLTFLFRTTPNDAPTLVASVVRIEGRMHIGDARGAVHEASVGERVFSGTVLTTDGDSRVALNLGTGLSVRVDVGSTVLMASADRLVLRAGAVYVDAVPELSAKYALVVDTAAGSVRHVGTQYQVRAVGGGVEISVREGRVEIVGESGKSIGEAGERLHVARNGEIVREKLSSQDDAWQWPVRVSPAYDIADSSVAEFLNWAARETGRNLRYGSIDAERSAATVKLHGSIAGLDPETAITAVLSTTGLQRITANDDSLIIDMRRE